MTFLNINEYTYELPESRIARFPLDVRDSSKLLVYENGEIRHERFFELPQHLPQNAFLFFNDTKVIPARLLFQKETGAAIEVFLLAPASPPTSMESALRSTEQCTWECAIGNQKRWTGNQVLHKTIGGETLGASLTNKLKNEVTFRWTGNKTFAEILEMAGMTPLPPYLNRDVQPVDRVRYQTTYSMNEGAVAAPTAGLHFTARTFADLAARKIGRDFLTLHVSAGTFQPVKTENANEHVMHREQVSVDIENIENLLATGRHFVAVGTTSLRTLESLYWYGVKLLSDPAASFAVGQDEPYTLPQVVQPEEALLAIKRLMIAEKKKVLMGETGIFIKPGYKFRVCRGLITNFHQPASTLLLLISAFVGDDWKRIYDEAMKNDYRFLSYGDSSLLLPG